MGDTIFALSSGGLPSGVAIIRLSGPDALEVAKQVSRIEPKARQTHLCKFFEPNSELLLDEGLLIYFPAPNSFTGEDVVELHCHGGVATVTSLLNMLGKQNGCRMAEAGEFSRRAFENEKIDLTGLEGLSDLIAAQTENQRRLALSQAGGSLRKLYDGWRVRLISARAYIEAELDFSDEEDIPDSVSQQMFRQIQDLLDEINSHLNDNRKGEIVRDGFRITLLGPPNSGKSSLLNALAKRDVAIVTPQAGTTRDVLEISLDIDGQLILVSDTAGLRQADDIVEIEGIKRALDVARNADLIFWLQASDQAPTPCELDATTITTKSDLPHQSPHIDSLLTINTKNNDGLDQLFSYIKKQLNIHTGGDETGLVTRRRHREALSQSKSDLEAALTSKLELELRSEHLRNAANTLARITGRIDVEDLLDVIFSEFCVGK